MPEAEVGAALLFLDPDGGPFSPLGGVDLAIQLQPERLFPGPDSAAPALPGLAGLSARPSLSLSCAQRPQGAILSYGPLEGGRRISHNHRVTVTAEVLGWAQYS